MRARRIASVSLTAALTAGLVVFGPARPAMAAYTSTELATHSFADVLVDPGSSQVFVSSPKQDSIVVFDLAGNLLTTITGETGANRMLVLGSTLYVSLSSGAIDRINTGTRTETSPLVTGLTSPGDLAYANSLIWTVTGTPGSLVLTSIDPAAVTPAATTYPGVFDSTNQLANCADFAANHSPNPAYLIAFACGSWYSIERLDVSGITPTQTATVNPGTFVDDVAVSDDNTHVLATYSGEVDEYNLSDLSLDGVIYPGTSRTTAVATTAANGPKVVEGSDATSGATSFTAYPIGDPAQPLVTAGIGAVENRGVAISPNGLTAYVLTYTLGLDPPNIWLNLVPLPALPSNGTPGAPTGVTATVGVGAAIVTWTPPTYHGTSLISSYLVSSSGGATATVGPSTSSALLAGLSPVPHTFTVQAINSSGPGLPSDPSNSVTPEAGGTFNPLTPIRILDTRNGTGGFPVRRVGPGTAISLQVTGRGGVPAGGVSAVVMNVTATDTAGPGFVTAYPSGSIRPLASNLNYVGGATVPNLVEVAVSGSGQVSLFVGGAAADLVADVEGWVGDATDSYFQSGLYVESAPQRLYDSRLVSTVTGDVHRPLGPNQSITLSPPYSAQAVILNVTATGPTTAGYLTVYPAGTPRPLASNLNFSAGQTVPNRVIVGLGGSTPSFTITNGPGTVDVVVDLDGAFSGSGGAPFVPLVPYRFADTRTCQCKMPPFTITNFQVTGPMTSGIAFNATATGPTEAGYLTIYGDQGQGLNAPIPASSDLNFTRSETVANFTPIGMSNTSPQGFNVLNGPGSTDVILDVSGYYGGPTLGLVPPGGLSTPVVRWEPRAASVAPRISSSPRVASG